MNVCEQQTISSFETCSAMPKYMALETLRLYTLVIILNANIMLVPRESFTILFHDRCGRPVGR